MVINTITWKGVSSTQITGLLIQELPPITLPPMRYNESVVDGRDGSIIEELGYGAYDKTITIGLYGNYDINAIISYFTGEGKLILSNEPNFSYNARIVSQIDFNRLVRYRTATVKFRVQPYKYKAVFRQDLFLEYEKNAKSSFKNLGNAISKPLILIYGSGTVEFKIDDITIFSYTFPDSEKTVYIDCEKEEAYNGINLRNNNMIGEFPSFEPGQCVIEVVGTSGYVSIWYASRWL